MSRRLSDAEIWKPVSGYEGLYEVSNYGNIRSVDHMVVALAPNGKIQAYVHKGRLLHPRLINSGYLTVKMKGTRRLLHRVVADAFIPNPDNLSQINHKDENKLNNKADNLEWCTPKYNSNYGQHNHKLSIAHINNPHLSFRVLQMDKECHSIQIHPSANEAARVTGVSISGIVRCCNNNKYYHSAGGYKWQYYHDDRKHI